MANSSGISAPNFKILGLIEIASAILFLIPRTGILGALLLIAYMGEAIATHLEHGESIMVPIVISAILWIASAYRFPLIHVRKQEI